MDFRIILSLQDFVANKCVLKGKYLLHPLFVRIIFLDASLLVNECLLFNLQQFTADSPPLEQESFLYYFSLAMFDKDFEIELHPTMAACTRGFEKRCEVPSQIDRDLWRNAWHRFSTDSFGQIPPLKCIRLSNPDAKNELVLRRLRYRLLAVLHFLPKFKAKQSLVTGKALIFSLFACQLGHPVNTRVTSTSLTLVISSGLQPYVHYYRLPQ